MFPDIPSEHTWGSLPRCIHLQGQCYRNTLWAALRTGTVPGALCTSLCAGPSIAAEKAQAVEKRNIMLDDKLAVEKDMVFGEGVPALLSTVAGVAMGAVPPPSSQGWHPLPACRLSAFQRGAFVLLKLLFKTLLCWFIPAVSSPLETPVCYLPMSAFGMKAQHET